MEAKQEGQEASASEDPQKRQERASGEAGPPHEGQRNIPGVSDTH